MFHTHTHTHTHTHIPHHKLLKMKANTCTHRKRGIVLYRWMPVSKCITDRIIKSSSIPQYDNKFSQKLAMDSKTLGWMVVGKKDICIESKFHATL